MKITDKREDKIVDYCDIEAGGIFSFDKQIWIKIRPTSLDGHNFVNALSLQGYSLDFFAGREKVTLLDGELIIKNA